MRDPTRSEPLGEIQDHRVVVRVQHIDVKRGPMDKLFGTASLVVHTAGTHNSIVTLPGLSPTRAADIRDDIRADIRTDAE